MSKGSAMFEKLLVFLDRAKGISERSGTVRTNVEML